MLPDTISDEFYTNIFGIADPENGSAQVAKALHWFLTYIDGEDWRKRREHQARALYAGLLRQSLDPSGKGRFYDPMDKFAYHLFQADAYSNHPHNYEPISGSSIIPVFDAVGRRLEAIKSIDGLEPRIRRMVHNDRSQPDGPLFELLVASTYVLDGYEVKFIPEMKGGPKTPDLHVRRGKDEFFVECKRLSSSDFVESERTRARELWCPTANALEKNDVSAVCTVTFLKPLEEVPDDYLSDHVETWLKGHSNNVVWNDEFGFGSVGFSNLDPLQDYLISQNVMIGSSKFRELLLGKHYPRSNFIELSRLKTSDCPRYAAEVDLVIACRYRSLSEKSTDLRARDVKRQLVKAYEQLPTVSPSIVHIGFDALEEPQIESVRAQKIMETVRMFEAPDKQLNWVFAHHFVPDSPPDKLWIFDETVQFFGKHPPSVCPLSNVFLVQNEPSMHSQKGHWEFPFE